MRNSEEKRIELVCSNVNVKLFWVKIRCWLVLCCSATNLLLFMIVAPSFETTKVHVVYYANFINTAVGFTGSFILLGYIAIYNSVLLNHSEKNELVVD